MSKNFFKIHSLALSIAIDNEPRFVTHHITMLILIYLENPLEPYGVPARGELNEFPCVVLLVGTQFLHHCHAPHHLLHHLCHCPGSSTLMANR
jgi:hypothetical protein